MLSMDCRKYTCVSKAPSMNVGTINFPSKVHAKPHMKDHEEVADRAASMDVDVDHREIYFLIMHFLSSGPCQKTFGQLHEELLEHKLLPRRYHACYSTSDAVCRDENDDGISFPLNYENLIGRYSHIEKDHLVKLLKQLMLMVSPPLRCMIGKIAPTAADVPTLLGRDSFSLLPCEKNKVNRPVKNLPPFLRWPHMQADQVRGLSLREIGGGFSKHHRAPSIRVACYAIAKPSSMVPKMQNIKKLRGHRDAVYCAIFDHSGRYVITGSDDRLVKVWSMETALCLASCRGHEGDITDLSVCSNNTLVASASNDFTIRVWRLPDGYPISVLRGHTGAVTAIAFSPRPNTPYHLLSSSDDGTCRLWDGRYSQSRPRVYIPKPTDALTGASSLPPPSALSSTALQCHQILCCAFNANGMVFVTGSSDTYARVWSACKINTDDPDQVSHEIDILAGHENDVNYVQFSGCAVASRSSPSDSFTEDNIPKFKNSWSNHDNIVTCSRDGSAIIWVPRSRRSHGKVGRWIRAYHLKVPPPPMPPQPPRGGPRQRLLPTPRGVNMITWSLDNRFVLAAIMDNRICVWNASDGSLVHSLAGHTASTYVLDVHPFNPRIAMSAGYDGKTILWDIWEGTPIRVYEIGGRFKLVDGKFSQDGTSIVLSDDVGQIYLLNTGEGESQKDAKYDQFFLGDYRPLAQDIHGNVVDQETQLVPYMRNVQDPLCDSSMLPYPEPYQSTYQQRRLGALGIEWRPSSIKFAIGTDIGMGQEFQILPLPDLDVVLEPLPDYVVDAMFWEPENDIIHDDNDSEYNVTEENFSDEQTCPSDGHSSDSACSEEDKSRRNPKDSMRRSKRKKSLLGVEHRTASGRRVKKRIPDEQEGTSSRSKRYKKSKIALRTSRRKSTKSKPSRPQRVAARNAINNFSQIPETTTDEDGEDCSVGETSDSESSIEGLSIQRKEQSDDLINLQREYMASSSKSEELVKPCLNHPNSQINVGNKKKLVLKFSLNRNPPPSSENHVSRLESQTTIASSTSRANEENPKEDRVDAVVGNLASSSAIEVDKEWSESHSRHPEDNEKATEANTEVSDNRVSWEKFKAGSSNGTQLGDLMPTNVHAVRTNGCLQFDSDSDVFDKHIGAGETDLSTTDLHGSSSLSIDAKHTSEPLNKFKKKLPIIKIKSIKVPGDSPSRLPGKIRFRSDGSTGAAVESTSKTLEEEPALGVLMSDKFSDEPNYSSNIHVIDDGFDDSNPDVSPHYEEADYELPDWATDSARRARSVRLKATSLENGLANHTLEMGVEYLQPGTSRSAERYSKKTAANSPSRGSKHAGRSKSSSNKREGYYRGDVSSSVEKNKHHMLKKTNWLLLSEQEEGYRYIPQLGDEVVYLRQGHQEYLELSGTPQRVPWLRYREAVRTVEICVVEELKYMPRPGSGESCCEITLKFADASCSVVGQKFRLILPELDFPDFIVERSRYDAAMTRSWTTRDKCLVWWRDDSEQGGTWWEGRIVAIEDKSSDFPGSPWERYHVKYKNDNADPHPHCPWELHDPDRLCEPPRICFESKEKILNSLTKLLRKASKDKDRYGIIKLNEAAQKLDFVNRFPVPLSPDIIKSRIENDYYRSEKAMQHDVEVMLENAELYFQRNPEMLRKRNRLSNWFADIFSDL